MKTSLSVLAAISATVIALPAFAESSSSASSASSSSTVSSSSTSSVTSASSSSSSAASLAPCMDRIGTDRLMCLNAIGMKNKVKVLPENRNSKQNAIQNTCSNRWGLLKALCVHTVTKNIAKQAEKKVPSILGKAVEQSNALKACGSMRGTAMARCIQNLRQDKMQHMMGTSSAASSAVSSSN